jgi:hypothetical protein
MCLTCDNFKRDLAVSGFPCFDFFGMHIYSRNAVDVSFRVGPLFHDDDSDFLVDCLNRNSYICKRVKIWHSRGEYYVDIRKLCDTRIAVEADGVRIEILGVLFAYKPGSFQSKG